MARREGEHGGDIRMTEQTAPLPFDPQLQLIEHPVSGGVVQQRADDGYINATELCQRAGKLFGHYNENAQTQAFLQELSAVIGIPITGTDGLVQIRQGGSDRTRQGTWVHPYVAIHLGQWLSPSFAVNVNMWVADWMQGNVRPYMPVHVQRYLLNRTKIPPTHFSMLNEMYLHVLAPLEEAGIVPNDQMMPDISAGRLFSDFLRSKGIDPTEFPRYEHEFTDGRTVWARLYPIEFLVDFRRYFHDEWLANRAMDYFKDRLPKALPYLRQILQLPPPSSPRAQVGQGRGGDTPN